MINALPRRIALSGIRFKFSLIAVFLSLVSFGIILYFSTRWMAEEIEGDYHEKASLMWTHILHDLENAMLRINHGEIFGTLAIYKNYKDVKEVRVYNSKGEEVFQSGEKRSYPAVAEALRKGQLIQYHSKEGPQKVSTFIVPIENKPVCRQCHPTNEPLRGALLLSLNREEMERFLGAQTQKFILFFSFLTVNIILIVAFTVNRLLLNPLTQIQRGAEAIARGDFNHRISVRSSDEVGDLARHFNKMAQTLKSLFQSIDEKRQEIEIQYDLISRSRQEWQETFDFITDPIVVMSRDCVIHQANKAFRKMFQSRMEPFDDVKEMKGLTCRQVFGTCFLPQCPHPRVIEEKASVVQEVEFPLPGTILEVSIFPYHRSESHFEGSITILKDVTEKREQERRLMLRERLSAIGQTVSGVAHEINNPLATIGVSAESLLKRVREGRFDPVLFESYLRIIKDEITRSQKITNSMLSFVKKEDHPKKSLDIHDVLDKTIELLRFQGKLDDIEVLKNYSRQIGTFRGYEGDLQQVFLSLLNNAIEAVGEKGKVILESIDLKDKIMIKISDTGPGIPPGHLERIFTPFFTTKSEQGGTGLGLFIAKKIIEENGGEIGVLSEEGKGTTVAVILPV
jgi:signal transduction histidine kinase